MKKIIAFILLISAFATAEVSAQARVNGKATIPASVQTAPSGIDSVRSAGVTANYLYVMAPATGFKSATFQVFARRVSTGMIGNMLLQASNDGVNYVPLSTTDSIHISNAATDPGDKFIVIGSAGTSYPNNGTAYKYFRGKFTQIAGDTADVKLIGYFR